MTYEFNVCEGFTIQHYGADDWFPVVNAQWWVREWLMCDEECRVEVETPRETLKRFTDSRKDYYETTYGPATWGEVGDMLRALGDTGPYGDGPVFAELTYNRENDLGNELLILAGWIDVSRYALHRGPGSPLLRAVFEHMPEHAWDEIGRVYVVAIAYGGAYGWSDTVADVYVSPNIDDDYDVARWQAQLYAYDTRDHSTAPVWDACGGWDNSIDGMEDAGSYPYGSRRECPPMYDVGELTGDRDDDELPDVITGTWLACGGEGVFAIGADGRVHAVSASVS